MASKIETALKNIFYSMASWRREPVAEEPRQPMVYGEERIDPHSGQRKLEIMDRQGSGRVAGYVEILPPSFFIR